MPMARSPLPRPAARGGRDRYIPRLTALEDRLLLSCHVTRLSDGNAGMGSRGTLRYCISQANQIGGPSTIDFRVTGTIHLTSKLPDLKSDLTITGPGANLMTVSGPGPFTYDSTVFTVDGGHTVAISGLTIADGYGEGGAGGVLNYGTLTLIDSAAMNNTNYFADPDGTGGGIENFGTMTISRSTVSGSVLFPDVKGFGGGIYNKGTMVIDSSTVSGNQIFGGGFGGGVYNDGSLDVRFSTVTDNSDCGDGWGIGSGGGYFNLYDTIVAGNQTNCGPGGQDVSGAYTGSSNLIGGDPKLGPLQNNGGPTQTHALLPGSPAIDAGDNTGAPAYDQRGPGFPRIVNGTIDIGAFELQNTAGPAAVPSVLATAPVAAPVPLRSPSLAPTPTKPVRPESLAAPEPAYLPIGTVKPATPNHYAPLPRAAADGPGADVLGWDWL
jgi:hypothetical protein